MRAPAYGCSPAAQSRGEFQGGCLCACRRSNTAVDYCVFLAARAAFDHSAAALVLFSSLSNFVPAGNEKLPVTHARRGFYFGKNPMREYNEKSLLLQVDGLIMPGLVELCAPHFVHALVIGATERHGRSKPNVEIAEIFESAYQFLGIELGAAPL